MTSERHLTNKEEWYRPNPSDRSNVAQRKVEELQRQIASMENDMKEKAALMQKLNRLEGIENEKREIQDKVLERNSRNNSPRLLQSEMDRLYRRDSQLDRLKSPALDRSTIETVIQQRTKEFSAKQQEAAMKAKYLDKERRRLQEARERVQEQRRALQNMSPAGKNLFSFHKDKLYMAYQPYHEFENKEERIRESFVLPVPVHQHPPKEWKFRLKFVPVPMPTEDDSMVKYNRQKMKEDSEEVDEALQAFANLTAKRKAPQKKKTNVKYVPEFFSSDFLYSLQKMHRHENDYKHNIYRQTHRKRRHCWIPNEDKPNKFRDTFKLTALYDAYRLPEKRTYSKERTKADQKNTLPVRQYPKHDNFRDAEEGKVKMKVKFNPVPYNETRSKYKYRTWPETI